MESSVATILGGCISAIGAILGGFLSRLPRNNRTAQRSYKAGRLFLAVLATLLFLTGSIIIFASWAKVWSTPLPEPEIRGVQDRRSDPITSKESDESLRAGERARVHLRANEEIRLRFEATPGETVDVMLLDERSPARDSLAAMVDGAPVSWQTYQDGENGVKNEPLLLWSTLRLDDPGPHVLAVEDLLGRDGTVLVRINRRRFANILPLDFDTAVHAEFVDRGDLKAYSFRAQAGDSAVVQVEDVSGSGALVPRFFVLSPRGQALFSGVDQGMVAQGRWLTQDGDYQIFVHDKYGQPGRFNLLLRRWRPPVEVRHLDGFTATSRLRFALDRLTYHLQLSQGETWSFAAQAECMVRFDLFYGSTGERVDFSEGSEGTLLVEIDTSDRYDLVITSTGKTACTVSVAARRSDSREGSTP